MQGPGMEDAVVTAKGTRHGFGEWAHYQRLEVKHNDAVPDDSRKTVLDNFCVLLWFLLTGRVIIYYHQNEMEPNRN